MNRNVTHIEAQAAEIQAEKLFPELIRQAALAHNIMRRMGHRAEWVEVGAGGIEVAGIACEDCGARATITVHKMCGMDAVLILVLPEGRCPHSPNMPRYATQLWWRDPYTNDAPDGREDRSNG